MKFVATGNIIENHLMGVGMGEGRGGGLLYDRINSAGKNIWLQRYPLPNADVNFIVYCEKTQHISWRQLAQKKNGEHIQVPTVAICMTISSK